MGAFERKGKLGFEMLSSILASAALKMERDEGKTRMMAWYHGSQ
jgi:hypothetical protein